MTEAKAWAVKDADGDINAATVGWTRKQAIEAWLKFFNADFHGANYCTWQYWYRQGHRVVRVRIIEDSND